MIRGNFIKCSFLERKQIFNFPALKFHVTSKILARGARNSNNHVEKRIINENDPLISTKSNVNFFGIESEEGVITTGSRVNFTQQDALKGILKENFHKSSFGVIRYDSDNELRFHGQYGKTDDIFPRNSDKYSLVSGNFTKVVSSYGKICNSSEINRLDSSVTSSKICEDDTNCSTSVLNEENSNHIDSLRDNQTTNYIDQYYFNNSDKEREQSVENISDCLSLKELNFIDQNYFGDLEVSETKKLSQDQNFFPNTPAVKEGNTELADQSFLENLKSIDVKVNKLQSLQNNSVSSLKYKEKENIIEDEFFSKTDVHISDKIQENNSHSKNIITSQIKNTSSVNSESVEDSVNINCNLPVKENNSKSENSKVKLKEPSLGRVNKDNDYSKSVEPPVSIKSPNNSKESDDVSNMTSAYDFVQTLRTEKKAPESDVKAGNKVLDMKVDSKGFRILKDQVEDLSYFTQDEILNILKQNILYSDDNLLILNKPYSLVMHESGTTKTPCLSAFLDKLADEINQHKEASKLYTVHRLDKGTTGCLLLARNETMSQHLKSLFAQRKIIKTYWVLTSRVPDPPEGVIDIPIAEGSVEKKKRMVLHPEIPEDIAYRNHSKRGKPAVTSYKVLSESGNAALVEATPHTGIKHQIRVHFGFGLCCPVLGDHKYSHLDKLAPQKLPSDILQRLHVRQSKVRYIPLHIHAKSITIPHYFEEKDLFVKAPLPNHMKENLRRLKFKK